MSTVKQKATLGAEVRRFVRAYHNGVLCSLSKRLAGYPFASVSPLGSVGAGEIGSKVP